MILTHLRMPRPRAEAPPTAAGRPVPHRRSRCVRRARMRRACDGGGDLTQPDAIENRHADAHLFMI